MMVMVGEKEIVNLFGQAEPNGARPTDLLEKGPCSHSRRKRLTRFTRFFGFFGCSCSSYTILESNSIADRPSYRYDDKAEQLHSTRLVSIRLDASRTDSAHNVTRSISRFRLGPQIIALIRPVPLAILPSTRLAHTYTTACFVFVVFIRTQRSRDRFGLRPSFGCH